ncbi:MAG: GH36-type glycosyl hydrolase domain-containing protein [Armatimonadota bacterium]
MKYGHFDDASRAYVLTDPLPPKPWINYLGNRRLTAFLSQNAGGLLWYYEPQTRRISRYHYIPAPADRPGCYVYVQDKQSGEVWNPHFAPTCTDLDRYECRHTPGVTSFLGEKDGAQVEVTYAIPPGDDVMLWKVTARNSSDRDIDLKLVSYLEFGLLEFQRETLAWCYLKHHCGFKYDPAYRAIRYDYHVFEAAHTPAMVFACTEPVAGYDCSRDAFVGRTGSLELPAALRPGGKLSNSELPLGGHGAGILGVDVQLAPGGTREFAYLFAIGDTWADTDRLLDQYADMAQVDAGIQAVQSFWEERLSRLQVEMGDAPVERFVNTWSAYNSVIALELARSISTDHMGLDGLRYRDTTQDALGVANIDPDFAADRMRLVFAQQTQEGAGCFSFYPHNAIPTLVNPDRSDNTVWQIYTMKNLVAETGDFSLLDEMIPFRDGGSATVYDHMLLGLQYIHRRRGPRGLPTLYHADWNDGLALFQDEAAESVMTGMQLVYSCKQFAELAARYGRNDDVAWCNSVADELTGILNSELVWDGAWYRRLLLSNGKCLGSGANRQGRIYLNPQSWAVIAGVGDHAGRGTLAMQSAHELLDTPCGLALLTPPFVGIPEPEDPPLGSSPGTGENGAIFCHANTWAIIAEALLGNAERAYQYYRQLLPEMVIQQVGDDHYGREPYVYVSSIVGPVSDRFGAGGISWLTGTTNWMYIAATHYLLGIHPTYDGLRIHPCLPATVPHARVRRRFRGCMYDIEIENTGRGVVALEVDGEMIPGDVLPLMGERTCRVKCWC